MKIKSTVNYNMINLEILYGMEKFARNFYAQSSGS